MSRGLLDYYFRDEEEILAKMLRRSTQDAWELVRGIMESSRTVEEFAESTTLAMREYS